MRESRRKRVVYSSPAFACAIRNPQNPPDYGRLQPLQQKHLLLEAAILYATRYYIGLINCPEHVLLKEKYQRHNFTS